MADGVQFGFGVGIGLMACFVLLPVLFIIAGAAVAATGGSPWLVALPLVLGMILIIVGAIAGFRQKP